MGLLDRLFGRKRAHASLEEDLARQQSVRGKAVIQSPEEVQATRTRMENEMDAQRGRRAEGSPPDA